MSSTTVNDTATQSTNDALTTTLGAKGDHPLSPKPTITKHHQWNGDPMDWESWPAGRPGPFVSESRMQEVKNMFELHDGERNEESRTKDHILHTAEFSLSGHEIFVGHVTEPELATRLENPHPESRVRLLFVTTERGNKAVLSTYTQRILSACGAPAVVWDTFFQDATSPFHSFIDSRDGNTVIHWWITLRFQWKTSPDALNLVSEPYLGSLQTWVDTLGSTTLFPKLYFSYNVKTQESTIITTDLNRSHLWMIQRLRELSGTSIQPEEIGRILTHYFIVTQECYRLAAQRRDEMAAGTDMATQTLDSGGDHDARVRAAELRARLSDRERGDFMAFRAALASLEENLQDFWGILNLDPAINESMCAMITEKKKQCEVISLLFDSIVSRYDRFLNLLLNYTNIRMIEGMKKVSEQNAKMTEEMKSSTEQNAEATKRMAELAELNRQQAVQSARQAQSMAVIAYDTKRDSEVMKAVTVVTLIFLPATFVSTVFSMGIFNFDQGQITVSPQGWIYLACTLPLTVVVLGVSLAWILWTGKNEDKPADYSAAQLLAQAADTLRLGAVRGKEGV